MPLTIENPGMAGVSRQLSSLTDALEEVKNARIHSGIHFHAACNDGQGIGIAVADYVLANSLQPVNGRHAGQLPEQP